MSSGNQQGKMGTGMGIRDTVLWVILRRYCTEPFRGQPDRETLKRKMKDAAVKRFLYY